jgi:hypothetical protein
MGIVGGILLAAFCVPVATSGLSCRDEVLARARSVTVPAESQGLDLQVRILHVRIEFPWMKSLPITPGRRIVISWLTEPER